MFKVKLERLQSKILTTVNNDAKYTYVISDSIKNFEEGKINIIFNEENMGEVESLVRKMVLGIGIYIDCENSRGIKKVNIKDIEYIESFDNDVYAIVGKDRYKINEKLYSLEEKLNEYDFIRISKSVLVNITKIDYIKPMFNCKLKLILVNNDIIEVNRTYLKSFKERLNGE